jgi:hypothetical protein
MSQCVWVTATRGNDLYFPHEFGELRGFKFHRRPVEYDRGEVRVVFSTWAKAQKAVNSFREGDCALWNAACS